MINLLYRLSPVRTDLFDIYPDLAPLRASFKSGNWSGVSSYFERLPVRADRSVAVRAVARTRGVESFLQRVVDSERDSSLVRTLLGARLIVMAWDARSRLLAQYVKQAQWQMFHDYLHRAERLLADATTIDPTNAAAWTERVTIARGLGLGVDEGQRRYDRAAEHCDVPYLAQAELTQNLCPKWGGSSYALLTFARGCLETGKPGTLDGAVLADALIEQAFMEDDYSLMKQSLQHGSVRSELARAAEQTVLHPDFDPSTHGAVAAHATFAYAFFIAGDYQRMAPHFAALGDRSNWYPWGVWYGNKWKDTFRSARRAARKW
ncbi:hypothetical protein [Micromonospora sp. NPDC093277]|uniref:hypothetical protein n=1 Tax=Micromonospora sp. NPDC093277 TaxID=3364291 RepID=UPI0037FCF2A1